MKRLMTMKWISKVANPLKQNHFLVVNQHKKDGLKTWLKSQFLICLFIFEHKKNGLIKVFLYVKI